MISPIAIIPNKATDVISIFGLSLLANKKWNNEVNEMNVKNVFITTTHQLIILTFIFGSHEYTIVKNPVEVPKKSITSLLKIPNTRWMGGKKKKCLCSINVTPTKNATKPKTNSTSLKKSVFSNFFITFDSSIKEKQYYH